MEHAYTKHYSFDLNFKVKCASCISSGNLTYYILCFPQDTLRSKINEFSNINAFFFLPSGYACTYPEHFMVIFIAYVASLFTF